MRPSHTAQNRRAETAEGFQSGPADELVKQQLLGSKGPVPGLVADRRRGPDRRKHLSFFSFLYGNFRPRRRQHRRKEDHHFFWFDWHEPRVLYLTLAIVLLSCADALFTLNLLTIGAVEANLLMDRMLSISVETFLWVKFALTGTAITVLVFASQRRLIGEFRVLHVLYLICAGYVLLIAYEIDMASKILGVDPVTLGKQLFIA